MKQFLIASILAGTVFSAPPSAPIVAQIGAALQAAKPTPGKSSLIINTHVTEGCSGPGMGINNATYGAKAPVQIRSYHLNRDLAPNEALDFYNVGPNGGPIDTAYNGNPIACSVPIFQQIGGPFAKAGCSTLRTNVGCVRLYTK